jgi:hypothetical protein
MIRSTTSTARFARAARLRLLPLLAVALAAGLAAPSAEAADAAALLQEGKKLLGQKKIDEACDKFAESYKQSQSAGTLIELGLCHERQGKIATAWSELLDAEADARKAARGDWERRAKQNSRRLEPKLPRLTVTVARPPAGLEITLDGKKLDPGALGKGKPVDPGEHKLGVTAPGHRTWQGATKLKRGERRTINVPALAPLAEGETAKPVDTTPPPPPSANADAGAGATTGGATGSDEPSPSPSPSPPPPPPPPEEYTGPRHRAKRVVVDVGVFGGAQVGLLGSGSLAALSGVNYEYRVKDATGQDAVLLETCQGGKCKALVDPAIGVPVGGQLFVGYAVSENFHFGARIFGSYLVTGGYMLLGGPSISVQVKDRLWLGGTLFAGFGAQQGTITGGKGEVPSEWEQLNGSDEVRFVIDSASFPKEAPVSTDFSFGLAGELSYALAELGNGKSIGSGSLVLSIWPQAIKTWGGFAFVVPAGIGYRFH